MQTVSISNKQFSELERLRFDNNIMNTEGQLFIEQSNDGNKKIIKKFYRCDSDDDEYFANKLLTINYLIDLKDQIGIDELVLPEKIVIENGQIVGSMMRYIDNINFKNIINSYKIPTEKVINYFKEIGIILKKIEDLNKNNIINPFHLNDVHESNFIFNKETKKINVVDLDSARILNNTPFAARYLTPFSPVADLPYKYKVCDESASGYIEPDNNSDIYCFIIMILNYLYKDKVNQMKIPEYYEYLNYLLKIDFPYELLDNFERVYKYDDNINPYELLDLIPKNIEEASSKVYKKIQ